MRFSGSQTVYPCKEHESVTVPFRHLLDDDGNLDLYPEVASKGYFDIDYRQGQLFLRSRGFVGLIPLSDRIAIHVEPRAPIGNLLYMIWRSGSRLSSLEGFVRGYQQSPGTIQNAEELYVATFLRATAEIRSRGVLKKYQERETILEKRGRLALGKTVSQFHSRGLRQHHVFLVHELTANNRANQILKYTAERLSKHFAHDLAGDNRSVASGLRDLTARMETVEISGINPHVIAREVPALIRGLPASHRFYEPALWLSYLIAVRAGVSMEQIGKAKFESVIIDVADVFERYVRTLCQESSETHLNGCTVRDGNINSVPLFVTTSKFQTQPDFYFQRSGVHAALADTKYKPTVSTEDRYALIAFCEALGVKSAAFVCPLFDDDESTIHQGTTRSGIELHLLRINLNAADLPAEEERFKHELAWSLKL